ncbi:hypothetical protein [Turicibacter sp.]|uniref:hypothetical protein n=1 Tax=Turicibacter sp. TaxID=2049042 RepID=UPI001B7106FF|nr:hypothetical protein [Turicibacter sp.]MBP3904670.1 hypothetical protein [Turicibacter sp.]
MNKYLAILFLSTVSLLSACKAQENSFSMNDEIIEEQTSDLVEAEPTIKVFEVDDYLTNIVTAELNEGEVLDYKDFITSINSMEEFSEYNVRITTQVSSNKVNITDKTFENQNVWYLRMYSNQGKLPIFQLSKLETFENGSGILYLDELGMNEGEPKGENVYCYSEYIFLTDLDIVELQIEYEDLVDVENRKSIELN